MQFRTISFLAEQVVMTVTAKDTNRKCFLNLISFSICPYILRHTILLFGNHLIEIVWFRPRVDIWRFYPLRSCSAVSRSTLLCFIFAVGRLEF